MSSRPYPTPVTRRVWRTNRLPTDSQPSRRTGPKLSGRMRVQSIRPSLRTPHGKLGKISLGLEGRVAEGDQAQWVPQKQRSRYETLWHGEPATRSVSTCRASIRVRAPSTSSRDGTPSLGAVASQQPVTCDNGLPRATGGNHRRNVQDPCPTCGMTPTRRRGHER